MDPSCVRRARQDFLVLQLGSVPPSSRGFAGAHYGPHARRTSGQFLGARHCTDPRPLRRNGDDCGGLSELYRAGNAISRQRNPDFAAQSHVASPHKPVARGQRALCGRFGDRLQEQLCKILCHRRKPKSGGRTPGSEPDRKTAHFLPLYVLERAGFAAGSIGNGLVPGPLLRKVLHERCSYRL